MITTLNEFRKIFETNDITQLKLYHGSNFIINGFEIQDSKAEDNFLGHGIYITNDIDVAKQYGKNLYLINLKEPLNPLQFFEDIDKITLEKIAHKFIDSGNDDLLYLGENYLDDLENDQLIWGKSLIEDLKRNKLDVNDVLLSIGYNCIICPLNKINSFLKLNNDQLNICVIKPQILQPQKYDYNN